MQQSFNQRIEALSAMLKNSLSELEKWCSGDACYTFGWSAGSFGSDEGRVTRIFVVHGHDNAVKESVARFLEKLNLKPIILQA